LQSLAGTKAKWSTCYCPSFVRWGSEDKHRHLTSKAISMDSSIFRRVARVTPLGDARRTPASGCSKLYQTFAKSRQKDVPGSLQRAVPERSLPSSQRKRPRTGLLRRGKPMEGEAKPENAKRQGNRREAGGRRRLEVGLVVHQRRQCQQATTTCSKVKNRQTMTHLLHHLLQFIAVHGRGQWAGRQRRSRWLTMTTIGRKVVARGVKFWMDIAVSVVHSCSPSSMLHPRQTSD